MRESISETVVKAFLGVPHDGRIRLCKELGLISDDETENVASWFALWRKALGKVAEKNLHSKLWDAIYNCGVVNGENPFEVAALVAELEFNVSKGFESRKKPDHIDRDKEKEAEKLFCQNGFTDPSRKAFNPMDGLKLVQNEIDYHDTTIQGLQVAKEIEATIGCVFDTDFVDVTCHDGASYRIPSLPPDKSNVFVRIAYPESEELKQQVGKRLKSAHLTDDSLQMFLEFEDDLKPVIPKHLQGKSTTEFMMEVESEIRKMWAQINNPANQDFMMGLDRLADVVGAALTAFKKSNDP